MISKVTWKMIFEKLKIYLILVKKWWMTKKSHFTIIIRLQKIIISQIFSNFTQWLSKFSIFNFRDPLYPQEGGFELWRNCPIRFLSITYNNFKVNEVRVEDLALKQFFYSMNKFIKLGNFNKSNKCWKKS